MVAERRRQIHATSAAMAPRAGASPLQKSLAEELAEVEAEEKSTGALQAVDHQHGMSHGMNNEQSEYVLFANKFGRRLKNSKG